MKPVRVFLITQEEPFYVPKVIRHLLRHQGREYQIVGATVLPPHRRSRTMAHWFRERARVYSCWDLFIAGSFVAWARLLGGSSYRVAAALRRAGIEMLTTADVNKPEYVATLRSREIDVIASVSAPQIFGTSLLEVPRLYCLNAHGTLLPRHRGVFGSWWTLYMGDIEAGATIHTMEERLDAGDIVWQRAFPVRDETQYSLAYQTKKLIAEGLVDVLRSLARSEALAPVPPSYAESYHRAPTKADGDAFYGKGLRIVRWRDLRYALARSFEQ